MFQRQLEERETAQHQNHGAEVQETKSNEKSNIWTESDHADGSTMKSIKRDPCMVASTGTNLCDMFLRPFFKSKEFFVLSC